MYGFQIRFFLNNSTFSGIEDVEFPIKLSSRTYILSGIGKKINKTTKFILTGSGFDSEKAAFEDGNRVLDVLRWCGAHLFGLELIKQLTKTPVTSVSV